jgi:protoporphyrinogen oxidase
MAWMWARLKARTTRLGTFEGGFQNFADLFAGRLREMGVEIRLKTPVSLIQSESGSSTITVRSEKIETFEKVLVTLSPEAMTRLVPSLPDEYLGGLKNMKSMGAVVMTLALTHQLSEEGYYWYNLPKSAGYPFLALVEHTNFVSPEHFSGDHLLYCGDYLETSHEYFSLTREQLIERFLPSLKSINPEFDNSWIKASWLFKTPYAQPVPVINHSGNIPSITTSINNLFFAGMSQIYPWDRGTNFAVELARKAAEEMNSASD